MFEREFQKKRKIRAWIYSKTTIIILIIIVFFLMRATWKVYGARVESRKDFDRAMEELTSLDDREKVLVLDIERLKTEKGTEEEIRKKFSVAKEGESVVFVVDREAEVVVPVPDEGFWSRVGEWFVFWK